MPTRSLRSLAPNNDYAVHSFAPLSHSPTFASGTLSAYFTTGKRRIVMDVSQYLTKVLKNNRFYDHKKSIMKQAPSLDDEIVLPENSKGKLADNPDILETWFTGDVIDPDSWPYLMLCRDQNNGAFTWHMLCDEYNIVDFIERGMKALVDNFMSSERKRKLIGIELLCRDDRHLFFE